MRQRLKPLAVALLATTVLAPVTLGSPAPAHAEGDRHRVVPDESLVPGYPLPPENRYQRDTPDQGMPRSVRRDHPGEREPVPPNPGPEQAAPDFPIEYVPPGEEADRSGKRKVRCSRSTGEHQREVERYLKLKVDGKQSPEDCKRIQAFQKRAGIRPANGFAGPVSYRVVLLRLAKRNPDRLKRCPTVRGKVACLDVRRQYMWVQRDGKPVFGPVPMRTGMRGYPTRTGWFRVQSRVRDEWSDKYKSPMPFSQYFSGGQAIHGIYKNIYSPPGSHGCVNLRYEDAKRLWRTITNGDRVYVWGKKPRV